MTEELKKEAEEWIKDHSGLIGSYMFVKYDYDSMQKAYLASAEPREKQIRALQKQNEELTNKVRELENKLDNIRYYLDNEIPHELINEATTIIYKMV